MKKSLSFLLSIVMLVTSLSVGMTAFADSFTTAEIEVQYHQSEARKVLGLVNGFRQSDTWCWNKNNTVKEKYPSRSALVYDYELEKIAMQRAAEISVKWGHNRPNGEMYYTAYPDKLYGICGENIAAGTVLSSADSAFTLWREDDEDYDGQGHRRNMLDSRYTSIGVACVRINNMYFWVQEFGGPVAENKQTAANNGATKVNIDFSSSEVSVKNVNVSVDKINLNFGESASLPVITADVTTKNAVPNNFTFNSEITPEWNVENKAVAQIVDGKIIAVGEGTTTVSATVFGKTVSFTVTVKANEADCKHDGDYKWLNEVMISKQCSRCGKILTTLPFTDLGGFAFYGDYVEYTSVSNKFITGTNPPARTLFSPTTPITRAMFVTILYRMAGEPYSNNNPYRTSPFTDITDTSVYYYDAACWALDKGITNQTTFKPFDNVSREQTASFLFRYAQANGKLGNNAYKNVSLSVYSDFNSVSNWAVEAMQWANYNGMITGTQQNTLNPQGATQRIHATKILYGFGKVCNIGNFA